MLKNIRTRFSPSPTGSLHVGGLRTALYSYLFARQNNGKFLLRIEDTDREREVPGAAEKLIHTLKQIGLDFDEGPILEHGKIIEKGEHGPYFQSKRLELYQKYAKQLIDEKKAYYCFCSTERLAEMRQKQQEQKQAPKYDRCCLKLTPQEVEQKLANQEKSVIRFKISDNQEIIAQDMVRGEVKFKTNDLDDLVILKSDGFPTYHLAHVVDDYLMKISHVIRGEEWLPSLPKHILMWQAFGWPMPEYAHLSLLLNPDKSKLSKRQGDVAVEDYLSKGYLPEAIINFVALLGWNPGQGSEQEIFSLAELIDKFEINNINKSGAVFNLEKLNWLNGQYIRNLDLDKLTKLLIPYLQEADLATLYVDEKAFWNIRRIIKLEQPRLQKLSDIANQIEYFFHEKDYSFDLLIPKKSNPESIKMALSKSYEFINDLDEVSFYADKIKISMYEFCEKNSFKPMEVLWPIRAALTGQSTSAGVFDLMEIFGKKEILNRIARAINKLDIGR